MKALFGSCALALASVAALAADVAPVTYPQVVTNEFRIAYTVSFEKGQRPENVLHYACSRTADAPEAKWQTGNVVVSFYGMTRVGGPSLSRRSCVPNLRVDEMEGGLPAPGEKRRVEIVHKGNFMAVYQEVGGQMRLITRWPISDWTHLRSVSFQKGTGTVSDLKLSVAADAPGMEPKENALPLPRETGASVRFKLRPGIAPADVRLNFPDGSKDPPSLRLGTFRQEFSEKVKYKEKKEEDGVPVFKEVVSKKRHRLEDTGLEAHFSMRDRRQVYSITRIASRYRDDQIGDVLAHLGDYGTPASRHDFLFEIRRLDAGWGLWMDGNFVGRLKVPSAAAEVVVAGPAESVFRRLEDGAAPADPMRLKLPVDKPFDTSVCKMGLGSYSLECDGYLSREPAERRPDAFLRRVPADTYVQAVVRCRVDPAPTNTCELTARLTNFHCPYNEGRSPDMMTVQSKTLERKAGEQTVVFDLEPGKIQDLVHDMGYDYLDLEILGGLDYGPHPGAWFAYKPSPKPSGVTVLGVELVRGPASLHIANGAYGNVFVAGERASVTAEVAATVAGRYRLAWEVKDLDGKVVETEAAERQLAAGETWRETHGFKAQGLGWYSFAATLSDASGRKVVRFPGAYTVIAPDTRKAGYESPFFTWHTLGTMDTNGFRRIATFLKKIGVRRTQLKNYTEEDAAAFGLTLGECYAIHPRGATQAEKEADFERQAREAMRKWPHIDSALILHENYGSVNPKELQGEKTELTPAQLKEQEGRVREAIWRAKVWRKVAPHVRLKVGNGGRSLTVMGDLFRGGYPQELIDIIGEEGVGQQETPERATGMTFRMLKDLAELYGYTNSVGACYEWKSRVRYLIDNERKQAAWFLRDILIALAWGSPQVTVQTEPEIGNSYFNTCWGSGALTHGPVPQPLPHITAVANLTRMMDRCRFSRLVPTGSQSVYAFEFRDPDGKYVYTLWTARGEIEAKFSSQAKALTVFDLYGREDRRSRASQFTAKLSEEPAYFWMDGPIASVEARGDRSYPWETHPGLATRKTLAALRSMAGWTVDTNVWPFVERGWMPFKGGSFAAENGPDGVVVSTTRAVSHHEAMGDYGFIRPAKPIPVPEAATTLALDVKGNSTWGKLVFEIEDAKGRTFLTAPDYYDMSDTMAFNFDGWHTLQFMIRKESPAKCYSLGSNMNQWRVQRIPGRPEIEYPVKVTAIGFKFVRRGFDLLNWVKPASDAITVRNLSCY